MSLARNSESDCVNDLDHHGTAPGYDHVRPEYLKNLGPRAQTWLSRFFSRIIIANAIPKIWRKMKVIAIEKPGKDPRLAESYRPIYLLSTYYKLLERLVLHRVSPEVEKLLSPKQAGFRRNRSTCQQVAALTKIGRASCRERV